MHIKNTFVIIGGGTLIVTFILVALLIKKDAVDQGKTGTITTADGFTLAVKEYPVSNPKMVSILLPNAGQAQGDLISVARVLQTAKIATITFDWRGEADGSNKSFSNADWLKSIADVDAVVAFAEKQYPHAKINLFGGDFGADMAIHYAALHANVVSVVALSPKPTTKGLSIVNDITQYQGPVFVMEYVIDPDKEELLGHEVNNPPEPGGDLILTSPNENSFYLVFPDKSSGWSMLIAGQPQISQIIEWMNNRL